MSISPTPWAFKEYQRRIGELTNEYKPRITDANGQCIIWIPDGKVSAENAKLLVSAVNQHEALAAENAALKQRVAELEAALAPFAKSAELFMKYPSPYGTVIYNPAAGKEYYITDRHLLDAYLALHGNFPAEYDPWNIMPAGTKYAKSERQP